MPGAAPTAVMERTGASMCTPPGPSARGGRKISRSNVTSSASWRCAAHQRVAVPVAALVDWRHSNSQKGHTKRQLLCHSSSYGHGRRTIRAALGASTEEKRDVVSHTKKRRVRHLLELPCWPFSCRGGRSPGAKSRARAPDAGRGPLAVASRTHRRVGPRAGGRLAAPPRASAPRRNAQTPRTSRRDELITGASMSTVGSASAINGQSDAVPTSFTSPLVSADAATGNNRFGCTIAAMAEEAIVEEEQVRGRGGAGGQADQPEATSAPRSSCSRALPRVRGLAKLAIIGGVISGLGGCAFQLFTETAAKCGAGAAPRARARPARARPTPRARGRRRAHGRLGRQHGASPSSNPAWFGHAARHERRRELRRRRTARRRWRTRRRRRTAWELRRCRSPSPSSAARRAGEGRRRAREGAALDDAPRARARPSGCFGVLFAAFVVLSVPATVFLTLGLGWLGMGLTASGAVVGCYAVVYPLIYEEELDARAAPGSARYFAALLVAFACGAASLVLRKAAYDEDADAAQPLVMLGGLLSPQFTVHIGLGLGLFKAHWDERKYLFRRARLLAGERRPRQRAAARRRRCGGRGLLRPARKVDRSRSSATTRARRAAPSARRAARASSRRR